MRIARDVCTVVGAAAIVCSLGWTLALVGAAVRDWTRR